MSACGAEIPVTTREQWLYELAHRLDAWAELPPLPALRIGVGFTSKGARSKRIGECWTGSCSADGAVQVFIHPGLHEPLDVAATLAHELVHAAVGVDAQHGPRFRRVALAIGLEGRMTATVAGPGFKARIASDLAEIGPYPHAPFQAGKSSAGPKQTTRMLKVECPFDGYTLRSTRRWLEVAVPSCPICQRDMEVK